MKYMKVALTVTLVMVLFTGCSKDTTLIAGEDGFYLQFNEPTPKPIHIGCQMAPEIRFKSIGKMLRTIKSGRFSQKQMEEVIDFDRDAQDRVILFDLDHVLEPVFPSGYQEMYVSWTGGNYSFAVKSPWASDETDYFIISQEKYHNENIAHYQSFDQFRECDRVTTENRDGIDVTVFDYTSSNSNAYGVTVSKSHRLCTYTLTDDNTELFIVESYDPKVSLQTPATIHIFGKSVHGYFNISIDDFTNRPSAEWLLEFDLRPYTGPNPTKLKETAQPQYDTSMYYITSEDGQYTLTLKTPLSVLGSCCSTSVYPKFTSISEMQQGIIRGPLSEYELCSLSRGATGIEICDPNHLYEFTAPDEFDLKYIAWRGKSYDCHLMGETAWGGIDCYNKEDYTESFNNGYKDFLSNPNITITEQINSSDRLATVYYGHTAVAEEKFVCYELRVGDKKMYIQEEYLLKIEDGRLPVSSEVPSCIHFWGTENGGYFHGLFHDFTQRPSVRWLSQFGITPYEEKLQ